MKTCSVKSRSKLCGTALKRTKPLIPGGKGVWQYPRGRPWALAGMVIILLLAASGGGYYLYQQFRPPSKVIILIANFDEPEQQRYRITDTVLPHLRTVLEPYKEDVEVQALGRVIKETEIDKETGKIGNDAARAEGKRHKATIVIWGWCGDTAQTVPLTVPLSVHFEVLRPPKRMPELGPEAKGDVQSRPLYEPERSVTLQTRLSAEMAYLSLFTVGMARYAAGDWDGAIISFSDALNQTAEPVQELDQSTVHYYRGGAYYHKGGYDQAIAECDQAINLNPNYAEAYAGRGLAYALKKEYDQAIADCDQAIALKPDLAWIYINRGILYHDVDLDQAIADFDQAVRLQPDDAGAYINRGNAYADKGNYDRAIVDYDQAVKLQPGEAYTYYNRGTAYKRKGKEEKAIADFKKVLQLSKDPYWRQQAEEQLKELGAK